MTVTTTYITQMSNYVLSDSGTGDFTTLQFNQFLPIAQARVGREDPGLAAAEYDYATALLVCHQIYLINAGPNGMKSESLGGYNYSILTDKDGMPTSPWMEMYKEVKAGRVVLPSTGVQRADVMTSAAFRFSNQPIAKPVFNDNTLVTPQQNQLNQ